MTNDFQRQGINSTHLMAWLIQFISLKYVSRFVFFFIANFLNKWQMDFWHSHTDSIFVKHLPIESFRYHHKNKYIKCSIAVGRQRRSFNSKPWKGNNKHPKMFDARFDGKKPLNAICLSDMEALDREEAANTTYQIPLYDQFVWRSFHKEPKVIYRETASV